MNPATSTFSPLRTNLALMIQIGQHGHNKFGLQNSLRLWTIPLTVHSAILALQNSLQNLPQLNLDEDTNDDHMDDEDDPDEY